MPARGPRSEVFTTVLVNEQGAVADWPSHLNRLHDHGKRLRLTLPKAPPEVSPTPSGAWQLARISCSASEPAWTVDYRPVRFRDEAIEAITVPAPRWNERTNGTKHGDWSAYVEALELAEDAGCDAALLVHDHAIVDGDRGTPLVLDEDGTVWMASPSEGGVDGVTASVLEALLPSVGLPVVKGKLNERTVARCAELVLVGTGMGACRISSLDGVALGSSTALSSACQRLLSQHFTEEGTWSSLGAHHV
ncbi:MAG: aminotransferase class IV [Candidatus Poseidoniales archaeon]|jgi:branched-subunit amino acid aminotransferase/4-amino-4-deoxychorismate lyase